MRRYISPKLKEQAKKMRKNGLSIGAIANKLLVAKSTIYEWVKTMRGAERYALLGKKRWLEEIQPKGALAQKKKREKKIDQIKFDVDQEIKQVLLSPEMQKAALSVLYWAEGTKGRGMVTFTNTDPRLLLLFITLLRNTYNIDEKKFRVGLSLHWYHKSTVVKKYWSDLLHIPLNQFNKIHWKQRSKNRVFRKNVGGICFLRYNSDYLREQLLHYAYAFGEKVKSYSAPVA
jgi:hypothetical protein